MKLFKEYLTESEKTYDFKIKLACEVTPEVITRLEDALKAFDLRHISKVKRLPLQNRMIDFATLGPCEVSLLDVVLGYPVNDEQLRAAIVAHAGIPEANLLVVPRFQPEEMLRDDELASKEAAKKEAILTQDYDKDTEVNSVYGDEYNKKLVKKLTTRKFEFAKYEGKKVETTNDLTVGTKSPLGSRKPVMPPLRKARK